MRRPLRQSSASIALIRRVDEDQTLWLAQWNENWHAFAFVGGHKHADETFREGVIREIQEELGLQPGIDFSVHDQPLAHLEYTAWSKGAQEETAYVMELFEVVLSLSDSVWQRIAGDSANRWLTRAEILADQTGDGRPVSETMRRVLQESNLL